MKTTRQLRLERLSTAAAAAGERSVSVFELVTFFNAYYEERCPVTDAPQGAIVHNAVPLVESSQRGATSTHLADAEGGTEEVRSDDEVGAIGVAQDDLEEDPKEVATGQARPSWRESARAVLVTVTQQLSPSARLSQLYTLGRRATVQVLETTRRVCCSNRQFAGTSRTHGVAQAASTTEEEDPEFAMLLRLALELEEAAVHAAASRAQWRAHKRQLTEACARLRTVDIDADASAVSCRLFEQLTSIVGALEKIDWINDDRDIGHAWV